jgi:hypothetical protein
LIRIKCNKRTKEILFHACLVINVTHVTDCVVLIKAKPGFKNMALAGVLNHSLTELFLLEIVVLTLKQTPLWRDVSHAPLGRFLTRWLASALSVSSAQDALSWQ